MDYCDYRNNFNFEGNEIETKEVLDFYGDELKRKMEMANNILFVFNKVLFATLAELIRTTLRLTSKAKLKVRSTTCDAENISALKILCCEMYSLRIIKILKTFYPSY